MSFSYGENNKLPQITQNNADLFLRYSASFVENKL